MVSQIPNFVSIYNFAVYSRKRSVLIPNAGLNQRVVLLLYQGGYILSYSLENARFIRIYPNYASPVAKLKLPSKTTKKFRSYEQLMADVDNGRKFVLSTVYGLTLCKSALVAKTGGNIILEFKYDRRYK